MVLFQESNQNKRILVFGGLGSVGVYVTNKLRSLGYQVTVFTKSLHRNSDNDVQTIVGDIQYDEVVNTSMENIDIVINLVGILRESSNQTFYGVHVDGINNIIAACKNNNVRRLICLSGVTPMKSDLNPFSLSKSQAEKAVLNSDLDFTLLRSSMVFSSDISFGILGGIARSLAITKPFAILPKGGKGLFQPIFIYDLVESIVRCVEDPKFSNKNEYNLCGSEVWSYKDLVHLVKDVSNISASNISVHPKILEQISKIGFKSNNSSIVTRTELDQLVMDNRVEGDDLLDYFNIDSTPLTKKIFNS
jgi:nucleoside-diphosphate-sugar epimerase